MSGLPAEICLPMKAAAAQAKAMLDGGVEKLLCPRCWSARSGQNPNPRIHAFMPSNCRTCSRSLSLAGSFGCNSRCVMLAGLFKAGLDGLRAGQRAPYHIDRPIQSLAERQRRLQ